MRLEGTYSRTGVMTTIRRWPSKMAVRDTVELGTHAAREYPLDRSTVHQ